MRLYQRSVSRGRELNGHGDAYIRVPPVLAVPVSVRRLSRRRRRGAPLDFEIDETESEQDTASKERASAGRQAILTGQVTR